MKKVVILGAGIAGLSCAYYLKDKCHTVLIEKNEEAGGLCQSFEIDGFWFDYGGHGTFTKNKEVRETMERGVCVTDEIANALNYKQGKWIKNPVQNNLFPLSVDEKIKILKDFINKKDDGVYKDYADWLKKKYGTYFAENYPYLYTKKYWTVSPEKMETQWIGPRMYVPTLDEVLYGSYTDKTGFVHYSGSISYPNIGGFERFLENLTRDIYAITGANEYIIDNDNKKIICRENIIEYDEIVSTVPLMELVQLLHAPMNIVACANELDHTSLIIVSFGIRKEHVMPKNGIKLFYVYDEEKLVSRAYSTSEFGKDNAPVGCSTIQAEVYFSRYKQLHMSLDEVKEKVKSDFIDMKLFDYEDIVVEDVRVKKYANILFTKGTYVKRKRVHEYLDSIGIYYSGRFGEWEYLWADQSYISGKKTAEKIISEKL